MKADTFLCFASARATCSVHFWVLRMWSVILAGFAAQLLCWLAALQTMMLASMHQYLSTAMCTCHFAHPCCCCIVCNKCKAPVRIASIVTLVNHHDLAMYRCVIERFVARVTRIVLWLSISDLCHTHCVTLYVHVKCMKEHSVRIITE